ncbi:MAG TPA: amidohydrolase family protein, partial [Gammaproteobacteria bacterium]|nr:amidohydrolase family protein [Gammaproteobacteria bacterium]
MENRLHALLNSAAWASLAALALGCSAQEPADLIVANAAIYTLDPERPWAEAMAVRDGRILMLGTTEEIRARYTGAERDAAGAMVLPGFHDAHVHPIDAGIDLARCDLSAAESIDAILATVTDCAARDPGDGWLLGYGWSLGLFPDGNPNKSLLDGIAADRPILLSGGDGHSSWANSSALARAGIDADTPDPPLGIIERDAQGAPSGTLRETAQRLLWSLVPEPTTQELEAALRRAVEILNGFGVTSLIEANADVRDLTVYSNVAAAGELDVRVVASIGNEIYDALPADTLERVASIDPSVLRVGAVKIYLDGVLEGETAALLEPYLGARGGHRGRLNVAAEALARRVTALDAAGMQVHVHAIGDRAVATALDAFAAA